MWNWRRQADSGWCSIIHSANPMELTFFTACLEQAISLCSFLWQGLIHIKDFRDIIWEITHWVWKIWFNMLTGTTRTYFNVFFFPISEILVFLEAIGLFPFQGWKKLIIIHVYRKAPQAHCSWRQPQMTHVNLLLPNRIKDPSWLCMGHGE